MKYCGHESFCIRKDWIAKGIRKIDELKKCDDDAMIELGIGKNMVRSLRYWLKTLGISNDASRASLELSSLGNRIKKYDEWTQSYGTLCLLQYNLATSKANATAWYFFFNEFNLKEFSDKDFLHALKNYDAMNNEKPVTESSLQKDFDCIKHTYIARNSNTNDGEENMNCPFSEFALIKDLSNGNFIKSTAPKNIIPPKIFLSLIMQSNPNKTEINLFEIQNAPCSAGKAFNLDTITLMQILSDLENLGYVQIVRTSGLDVLRIKTKKTADEIQEEYFKEFMNERFTK